MGIFESVLEGNPTLTYGGAMEWAAWDFLQDFEAYWSLTEGYPPEDVDPNEWQKLKELSYLATKMASGASTLIRPRKLSQKGMSQPEVLRMEADEYQKLVDSLLDQLRPARDPSGHAGISNDVWWYLHELFSPRAPDDPRVQRTIFESYFEAEADRHFGTSARKLAARMTKLIPYLLGEQGELTSAYLTRVAGCYVREMKPEFAVMARAVLDSAIQVRLDDDAVRRRTRADKVTLALRIQACLAIGLFDEEQFRSAERLREAGRIAAHLSPGLEGDLDALLDDLVNCLRALDPK